MGTKRAGAATKYSLSSIGWRRGPGRGAILEQFGCPSSFLSPLLRREERKKKSQSVRACFRIVGADVKRLTSRLMNGRFAEESEPRHLVTSSPTRKWNCKARSKSSQPASKLKDSSYKAERTCMKRLLTGWMLAIVVML